MTNKELFQSVGFVGKYYSEMRDFYVDYFKSEEDMLAFFVKVFKNDENDKKSRQMMNQIKNLVSIANDIDKIRPARDPLRIFFIRICLEALYAISEISKTEFFEKFPSYISSEGQEYILNNFLLTDFEDEYKNFRYEEIHDLTIDDFFEIIRVVRNIVAHEGTYWEMQFFAHDNDSTWISKLITDRKILKSYEYKNPNKMLRTYSFETKLEYDRFVYYFVEACINFLLEYIEKKGATKSE